MINSQEKVNIPGQMVQYIKDSLVMDCSMVKEPRHFLQEIDIKDNLKMISFMAWDVLTGLMEITKNVNM